MKKMGQIQGWKMMMKMTMYKMTGQWARK